MLATFSKATYGTDSKLKFCCPNFHESVRCPPQFSKIRQNLPILPKDLNNILLEVTPNRIAMEIHENKTLLNSAVAGRHVKFLGQNVERELKTKKNSYNLASRLTFYCWNCIPFQLSQTICSTIFKLIIVEVHLGQGQWRKTIFCT